MTHGGETHQNACEETGTLLKPRERCRGAIFRGGVKGPTGSTLVSRALLLPLTTWGRMIVGTANREQTSFRAEC